MGMTFGQFGREDGVLAMVTQNGCLIIKILKRTVIFEEKELIPGKFKTNNTNRSPNKFTKLCFFVPGPPQAQSTKLNVPKKTKLFAASTMREREMGTSKKWRIKYSPVIFSCVVMHQLFQKDLFSLKLDTSRSYVKSLATSMAPMVTGHGGSYNISAQVVNSYNLNPQSFSTSLIGTRYWTTV